VSPTVREPVTVRPLAGEQELASLGHIVGWAFGVAQDDSVGWLTRAGLANIRVAQRGGQLVGGLLLIRMAQWFGGKSVPMVGIAGVATAPEARGTGVAGALMRAAVSEIGRDGIALSALYPATLPLYRSAGYEVAGSRFSIRVRPRDIGVRASSLPIRPIVDADEPAILSLYAGFARQLNGYLDRSEYIWRRVRAPRDGKAQGYLVEQGGSPAAYLYVRQKPTADNHYDLAVSDAVASTPESARALLSFLGGHHTLGDGAIWFGNPADPLLALVPERGAKVTLVDPWMLRIADVSAALGDRGYAEGVAVRVELDVRDELLDACRGRFVLTIEGGRGRVSRGGSGAVSLDVRALAALYTGFASPDLLARQGLLCGDEKALSALATAFAGPHPTMPDMF